MHKLKPVMANLRDWVWDEERKSLRHYNQITRVSLGVIQMANVVDLNDTVIYQQPWWLESRGEIDIVIDKQQRFLFVEAERHAVIPPEAYEVEWSADAPIPPFKYESGVTQLELPRGFSGSILQEAEEETRYQIEFVAKIGRVNANTSFFGTSPFVVVGKALPSPSEKPPDPHEQIKRVVLVAPRDVGRIETCCGFTKAALWDFCRWALAEQDDEWWKRIADEVLMGWRGLPR